MSLTAVAEDLTVLVAPRTLEEAGLGLGEIVQLLVKTLHFASELTGVELSDRLGLSFSVIEPGIERLKIQRLCEIAGGTELGPPSYRYRITQLGREHAGSYLDRNMYMGVAPVPVEQYRRYMAEFQRATAGTPHSRAEIREAFAHLVLSDRVIDQLGPAINAAHSLFVYGPPGNGKTVIAQSIRGLLPGHLWVPHAIEVDGSLIRVYDPVAHEPLPVEGHAGRTGLDAATQHDRRWVRCRRPAVTVGGELTLDQLDLAYGASEGFYRAPVQLVANGGVLIVDDFGRQQCSPAAILNRWITPLEGRVDFLTLQSGQKVSVPFDVLPVFATNLRPADLMDEAFLRRIHYKVLAESPTSSDFHEIFANYCGRQRIAYEPCVVHDLLTRVIPAYGAPLRGCQPRDLIEQALALAQYRGEPRELTSDLLEAAAATYFVNDSPRPT